MSRYGLTGLIPTDRPSVFGERATMGVQPAMRAAMFGVGGRADMGVIPDPRASARGKKVSELKVVASVVAKAWGTSEFELDQPERQALMAVRTMSADPQVVAFATVPQFNSLLRGVYEKNRSIGRLSRFDKLDDKSQIDEFIYQMNEGPNDLFLLGVKSGRITEEVRRRALDYFAIEGILSLWAYGGVLSAPVNREEQESFSYVIAFQGPEYLTDVFHGVRSTGMGAEVELGQEPRQGMFVSYVLTRRQNSNGEFGEFVLEPTLSDRRYIDKEAMEFENFETGAVCDGAQIYVGEILDVPGQERDATLIARSRGIGVPWKAAHEAFRHNDALIKVALGTICGDAANQIS